MNFSKMFKEATGNQPFPYQQRMAEAEEFPSLLEVPTGAGKTAAAILGWLWRRRFASDEIRQTTPRRLVYCLPMRVLVEQTWECAVTWLYNLELLGGSAVFDGSEEGRGLKSYEPFPDDSDDDPEKIRVHLLMGGEVDRDWDMYPERDAILIGTQDMLLSRALNRGYAMSRYRWPVQFGLLNNDCLWVMDEVQLMSNGLATTTQLQAFRRLLGTSKGVRSIWMSATVRKDWLETVDFDVERDAPGFLELSDDDKKALKSRLEASKPVQMADFTASEDGKTEAELLIKSHKAGTRSLMIANTVKRAQKIYNQLKKRKPEAEIILLHSRFRPLDRNVALKSLLDPPGEKGVIAICTQVVEAGVDVSARLLISDLAPWASLVQRFGRCNRRGEFNGGGTPQAQVIWIPPEKLDDPKDAAPYSLDELKDAQSILADLVDVGPHNLPAPTNNLVYASVLRKKDLVELFDTTPDLAGADIDVSRFIREADEHDVQVFWRDIDSKGPSEDEHAPSRDELCSVSVGDIRKFNKDVWRWDYLDKKWIRVRDIYPGLVLMLRADDGGYGSDAGWTGNKGRTEPVEHTNTIPGDANDTDLLASGAQWQTIAQHTDEVVREVENFITTFGIDNGVSEPLLKAARWHDVGKAHQVFQHALPEPSPDDSKLWGKSKGGALRYERRHFRHELASGIVMLLHGQSDLAAYLAASHHGKVRLSIRSLPDEKAPDDETIRFARGVWDNDLLPSTDIGGGVVAPATVINLSFMELGEDETTGPSWLARMLCLRDDPCHGPFRLAFVEAIIRIADWRASAANANTVEGVKNV